MPRKKNLDLASELGEDIDVNEDEANDANQIVPKAEIADPMPPPASASMRMSAADIQSIVRAAIEASQGGNRAIADQITQGIAQARQPIPERTDADNPRVSTLNPLGEKDHPRPGLKCQFFIGTREPKGGAIHRSYEWLADDLTAQEQIALNALEPSSQVIKLLDGTDIKLDIIATRNDITNDITRMVLVVPQHVIQRGSQLKNMLPSLCHIVEQVTGKNFALLKGDDLAWFMAEHRAKRYVTQREPVAA